MDQSQKAITLGMKIPVEIQLTVEECNSLLELIDEMPRKTAQPIYDKFHKALIAKHEEISKLQTTKKK